MPIRITLKQHVILADKVWGTKQEVDELNLQEWRDVIAEDIVAFLDGMGGLENLIVGVEWVETP